MRAIVSQAWAGIANTSLDGEIALANRRFAEILGQAEQDLVGQRIEDFNHPDDRARERELLARLAENGEPFEVEKRLVRGDRTVVWVKAAVTPLRDAGRTAALRGGDHAGCFRHGARPGRRCGRARSACA